MAKFRLLQGLHAENDSHGKPVFYKPGDIIETSADLTKFNLPHSRRFEQIQETKTSKRQEVLGEN